MSTRHLPELIETLERRTLALFIGADLSREVTGLPSRADLARDLARRKGLDETLSLAEVAQRVGQAGNRWEFTDFIRNALDTMATSPAPFHQGVAELVKEHQIETIITIAYDNLLELAFRGAGIGLNRVVRGGDVNFISPDRPTLVKLYGDAQQPDTLVVTDRDHSELLRDRDKEALLDEVRRAFRRNTMLFFGYNLADADFRFLFDQIAGSRFARTAYAVWPGLSKVDVQMWRGRGIVILDADSLGILDELPVAPQPQPPGHQVTIKGDVSGQVAVGTGITQIADQQAQPASPPTRPPAGGEINLDRGLEALRSCLADADDETRAELATLEERLSTNRRDERVFGSSENTRNERAQIIFSLNELALEHCGASFNELCQGVEPKPSPRPPAPVEEPAQPEPSPPPPQRERSWIPFKLQIARLADQDFEVRAFETPMGQPHATGQLPYHPTELIPVLKALEFGQYQPDQFSSTQTELLQKLGLLRDDHLVRDFLSRIGGGLYHALFPAKVETAFQMALNQAHKERATVALQLRFDQDAVALARYPWELLHDGHRHLLSGGLVELARYIAYPQATVSLPVASPWRLLYITARPQDLAPLSDEAERLAVWNGLDSLAETGALTLDRLDPPTYEALLDRTAATAFHIIHFDGHGLFARRCPECAEMNHPRRTTCRSCAAPLDDVPPVGYLAFEDEHGDADYVGTEAMENLLLGSEVRLILLSACQSAAVQGDSLFGGLGPGLIRAGIPAVVAMQFSVPDKAAVSFSRGFYTALAQGEPVPRAVAQGRRRLFRDKTWFIPSLYLRSTDDEGRLFVK